MAELDAIWCAKIVDALLQSGVRDFCISPGSRSTPLMLAISARLEANIFAHFDERGMAFHALGRAKAGKAPVALLVTSGSALGNLFPAVMEAFHSGAPLIILTADRPPELRDTCASQTTDQVKFFGPFVHFQTDLPVPSSTDNFLASTIAFAATKALNGPVHLNCQFREPFGSVALEFTPEKLRKCYRPDSHPSEQALEMVFSAIKDAKRGVIRLSGGIDENSYPAIIALAEKIGFPIFADIQSGMRDLRVSKNLIAHSALITQTHSDLKADLVIHFGSPMLAKNEWHSGRQIHLSSSAERQDPSHKITEQIVCDPKLFCEKMAVKLPQAAESKWLEQWRYLGESAYEIVSKLTGNSDLAALHAILQKMDSENLFIGNSLPIHNADLIYYKKGKIPRLFFNRGLAGIDGNIATACGICAKSSKSTAAIIGDLTALHDLNSLSQISALNAPFTCAILNNSSGGIFSQLPVKNMTPHFERLVATAHTYTFEGAATQFNLTYARGYTSGALVEITTDRNQNERARAELFAAIQEIACHTP